MPLTTNIVLEVFSIRDWEGKGCVNPPPVAGVVELPGRHESARLVPGSAVATAIAAKAGSAFSIAIAFPNVIAGESEMLIVIEVPTMEPASWRLG